jgi:hypothetical protein
MSPFIQHAVCGLLLTKGATLYYHTTSKDAGPLLRLFGTSFELMGFFRSMLKPWCPTGGDINRRTGTNTYEFKTHYHVIFSMFYDSLVC